MRSRGRRRHRQSRRAARAGLPADQRRRCGRRAQRLSRHRRRWSRLRQAQAGFSAIKVRYYGNTAVARFQEAFEVVAGPDRVKHSGWTPTSSSDGTAAGCSSGRRAPPCRTTWHFSSSHSSHSSTARISELPDEHETIVLIRRVKHAPRVPFRHAHEQPIRTCRHRPEHDRSHRLVRPPPVRLTTATTATRDVGWGVGFPCASEVGTAQLERRYARTARTRRLSADVAGRPSLLMI